MTNIQSKVDKFWQDFDNFNIIIESPKSRCADDSSSEKMQEQRFSEVLVSDQTFTP